MNFRRRINYYPAAIFTGSIYGTAMWQPAHADPQMWARDALLARSLGFGTLRVFLQATGSQTSDSDGAFNIPTPLPSQLARFTQFSAAVKAAGLKISLSLFDWWGSYGHLTDCQQWIPAIAGAVDHSVLESVELQNETYFASADPYQGGFDPAVADPPVTVGQAALWWAQQIIPTVRAAFPRVPLAVSTTGDPATHLAAAVTLGDLVDWYDWHCYDATVETSIAAAVKVAGGLPLRIGETGFPSSKGQQVQADYLWRVRASCFLHGLPEPAPWCLYDFPGVPGDGGTYGLLTAAGAPKQAALGYLRGW